MDFLSGLDPKQRISGPANKRKWAECQLSYQQIATRINTNSPAQQFVKFKADTEGLQSNRVQGAALRLPDRDTEPSEGNKIEHGMTLPPLKCGHVLLSNDTVSRAYCLCVPKSLSVCVSVFLCRVSAYVLD